MGTPHKHAAIIKAWADGATIEVRFKQCGEWGPWKVVEFYNPFWWEDPCYEYRVKPKPDIIKYCVITTSFNMGTNLTNAGVTQDACDNVRLVFDGETGKLKSAEVLK